MKNLVLVLAAFVVSAFTFTASAASYEPAAKLLMITTTGTQASSPDVEVVVNWTDFDSMTECSNAVWLLTNPSSVNIPINGTDVKGQKLVLKAGPQGNAVELTYRCIPAGYTRAY